MKENTVLLNGNNLIVGALGVLAALLVFAVLTDKQVPLISGDRASFFVLLIIGFAMCTFGSLKGIQPDEWLHPLNLLASLLGSLALLLGLAVLTGFNVPLISDNRMALVILTVVIFSKVVLATLHRSFIDRLAQ